MSQLDLFNSRKASKSSATVYHFPLARRRNLVRETVADLLSRNREAGRRFWNAHVRTLRRELRNAGMRSADVDQQIRDYTLAVRVECLSSLRKDVAR